MSRWQWFPASPSGGAVPPSHGADWSAYSSRFDASHDGTRRTRRCILLCWHIRNKRWRFPNTDCTQQILHPLRRFLGLLEGHLCRNMWWVTLPPLKPVQIKRLMPVKAYFTYCNFWPLIDWFCYDDVIRNMSSATLLPPEKRLYAHNPKEHKLINLILRKFGTQIPESISSSLRSTRAKLSICVLSAHYLKWTKESAY